MNCNRCGTCCKQTFFALRDVPVEKDTREIARWASYHGVKVGKYPIDGVEYLSINIPGECQFLVTKEDGTTECAIYISRPELCKKYFCKKSQSNA